jgi:hypothetical protein
MSRRSIPHAGQSGNPAGRRNVIRNLMTDENTRHVARVIIKPQALEVCLVPTGEAPAQTEDPTARPPFGSSRLSGAPHHCGDCRWDRAYRPYGHRPRQGPALFVGRAGAEDWVLRCSTGDLCRTACRPKSLPMPWTRAGVRLVLKGALQTALCPLSNPHRTRGSRSKSPLPGSRVPLTQIPLTLT